MSAHWLGHWAQVTRAAEAVMRPDDSRDVAAVLAAASMEDAFRHGRRVPRPTPELCAQLAYAETLAQRA